MGAARQTGHGDEMVPVPGFALADMAPFRGGRGALRLGLSALPERCWRETGAARAARAAAKAVIFDAAPESLVALPIADAAIAELAALVGAAAPTLRDAALATYEDLCLLLPQGGAHVLVAGAVAFPTDWQLEAKIGHPLAAIHAPIPTYADRLATGVDHVFRNLAPGRMLTRANWNILETDALRYLPAVPAMQRFGHVTAQNAGETLFVRVERQVLHRLPKSNAALFSIGVYVEPLAQLSPALARDLAAAVASLPDAEATRRGAPAYAMALAAYVRRLATL